MHLRADQPSYTRPLEWWLHCTVTVQVLADSMAEYTSDIPSLWEPRDQSKHTWTALYGLAQQRKRN